MPTMSVSMVRMAVPMKSTTKPHMTARWKTPAKRSRLATVAPVAAEIRPRRAFWTKSAGGRKRSSARPRRYLRTLSPRPTKKTIVTSRVRREKTTSPAVPSPSKTSRVTDRSNIWAGSSAAQALGQRRHDLEDVGHRPVVGDTEDRCVRVRVDGHDQLGVAHPLQVLRRAADTEREVQLRFHPQAGLADLACPRQPARVGHRTRGGDGTPHPRRPPPRQPPRFR